MAKIPFTKLGLTKNTDVKTLVYSTKDNQEFLIEVKQYLPIEEKIILIENILNGAADDKQYFDPFTLEVLTAIEIFINYTNINLIEKQKEDKYKLYDLISSTGLLNKIIETIPAQESGMIFSMVYKATDAVFKYKNSVRGILDDIGRDYSNMSLDAEGIQKNLADPNNLALLKDIVSKLG